MNCELWNEHSTANGGPCILWRCCVQSYSFITFGSCLQLACRLIVCVHTVLMRLCMWQLRLRVSDYSTIYSTCTLCTTNFRWRWCFAFAQAAAGDAAGVVAVAVAAEGHVYDRCGLVRRVHLSRAPLLHQIQLRHRRQSGALLYCTVLQLAVQYSASVQYVLMYCTCKLCAVYLLNSCFYCTMSLGSLQLL